MQKSGFDFKWWNKSAVVMLFELKDDLLILSNRSGRTDNVCMTRLCICDHLYYLNKSWIQNVG